PFMGQARSHVAVRAGGHGNNQEVRMRRSQRSSGVQAQRSGFSRRQLLQGAAGAGLGAAALSRAGYQAFAQDEEIPREPSSATVDGKLQVLQKIDFHPDHNQFIKDEIAAYAALNGWEVEVSEVG